MLDLGDILLSGLGLASTVAGGYLFVRRVGRSVTRQDAVSPDRWQQYALERGWRFHDGHNTAKMHGHLDGQPFSATATFTTRHTRRGPRVMAAETSFRVPIRGRAPAGFLVRRRAFANQVRGLFDGGRPITTGDRALDDQLQISGVEVDETVLLARRPAVREALLALFRACPEAVVHDRAVEFRTPGMVSSARHLDLYLGLMTTVAAAIEGYTDRLPFEGARAEPPADPPDDDLPEDTGITLLPGSGPVDLPMDDEVPPPMPRIGPLYLALRGIGSGTVATQQLRLQHLRLQPYTYELEVRSVNEAMSRLGIKTGKFQVNGVLTRARWRVEMVFDAEHAEHVLTLLTGDVIAGECLLEDMRGVSKTIEATARGAPTLVEPSRTRQGT